MADGMMDSFPYKSPERGEAAADANPVEEKESHLAAREKE
jgi:hypothetical protein